MENEQRKSLTIATNLLLRYHLCYVDGLPWQKEQDLKFYHLEQITSLQ